MNQRAVEKARTIYNVAKWSDGYFDIDERGELVAFPDKDRSKAGISLSQLTEQFKEEGLTLPVLVRFTDILQNRVDTLINAFSIAKDEKEYQGQYTAVYPIKVNQQYSVVKKLIDHHSGKVGLEAGSKPELMAILGVTERPLTIVCNGYKDSEFLRLATIGHALGHDVNIVVEKLSELKTLIQEIDNLGVEPNIGIRIKLNSVGKGKWQNTGGEKGKFGLTASQVLQAVDLLRSQNKLHLLTLVHYHIGSQIANIRDIHGGLQECARHFAELRKLGVPLKTVDVGGGLGVDYEGSGSRSPNSMNYSVLEYARNVVGTFADVCALHDLEQPNIITESGRAMTAHHAVLITDAIDVERAPAYTATELPEGDVVMPVYEMWNVLENISHSNAIEAYHDAIHWFSDAYSQYVHGILTLTEWAQTEQLYFAVLKKLRNYFDPLSRSHREILDDLNEKLADKLFVNFSLFQSLPDAWGIDQLFPIMPLNGMDKPLTQRAILQDITCDSDGMVKTYMDGTGLETSMQLPEYKEGEQFNIAMFMVGAYQEILGDLHNLFGDTDSVHVELNDDGGYRLNHALKGDSVANVLRYVAYNPEQLLGSYLNQVNRLNVSDEVKEQYFDELRAGIEGYTYFED